MFYEVALIELTALQSTGKYFWHPAVDGNFSGFALCWSGVCCVWPRESHLCGMCNQKLTSLGNFLQNERMVDYPMSGWGRCTAKIFRLWLTAVLTPLAAVKSCLVLRAVLVYIIKSLPINLWIVANKELEDPARKGGFPCGLLLFLCELIH